MTTTAVSTPARPAALDARTMCEALMLTAAKRPDQVALRTPEDRPSLTFKETMERVAALAAGLDGLGVRRGDTVGLMMVNRPGFHMFDAAAMMLGAAPFSVYNTSPPEQVGYVMSDAGNRVVITERQFVDVVRAAGEHGAQVDTVVSIDGGGDLGIGDLVRSLGRCEHQRLAHRASVERRGPRRRGDRRRGHAPAASRLTRT